MTTTAVAEVSLEIAAAPAAVYRYLTDPHQYPRWMGAAAVLDPRPGGRFQVSMADGFRAAGRFVSLEPPHRVVFTWGFADDEAAAHTKREPGSAPPGAGAMPDGSTRVTIVLEAEAGRTRLTLRHDRLPDRELAAAHQLAWETYLPRLAIVAAGGDPGPDPHG